MLDRLTADLARECWREREREREGEGEIEREERERRGGREGK